MKLSEHFTAEEIGYEGIPASLRPNALATVALLESLRRTWGVPVRVTSFYRSPASNATLAGASSSSQHMDATAADVQPIGLAYDGALARVRADVALQQLFGQFIAYRGKTHFHIALPTRGKVGEILEQVSEDAGAPRYAIIAPASPVDTLVRDASPSVAPYLALLVGLGLVGAMHVRR